MQRQLTTLLALAFSALGVCLLLALARLPPQRLHAAIPHPAFQQPLTTPLPVDSYLPVVFGPPAGQVIIAAAHIDSAISGERDEAILLWNIGLGPQPLAGWRLATRSRSATFPVTTTLQLAPGERLWCTADGVIFAQSFGEAAPCVWGDGAAAAPAIRLNGAVALTNGNGRIQLFNARNELIDALLYGDEQEPISGWQGAAAQLYTRGDIPTSGQIWQRKRAPFTALPIDSDQASDWAGDLADLAWGRQARLPGWQGWDADTFATPWVGTATATITVAIGPEGLYQPLAALFARATQRIDLSLYTFEHVELANALVAAAQRGVAVRLLLEGSPPGGISDLQKWCVAQIVAGGGEVRYLAVIATAPKGYRPRYRFLHAKYGIIDGQLAFNGTENLSDDAMPIPGATPPGGRRGFYLITEAAPVAAAFQRLFTADWAPDRFLDLQPFEVAHEKYGGPPADFVLPAAPSYTVSAAPFGQPVVVAGTATFQLISAPENASRPDTGIAALLAQAGPGDEITTMQLYEHKFWGDSVSNPVADPNPRLAALLAAARRGAHVRLLLDSFFDEPTGLRSNQATVAYVNALAAAEGLALEARLGNPTQGGIHAKLWLIRLGERRWSAVGSLNGSEVSHKLNREVVLLTDLPGVYTRLAEVFAWDWAISPVE